MRKAIQQFKNIILLFHKNKNGVDDPRIYHIDVKLSHLSHKEIKELGYKFLREYWVHALTSSMYKLPLLLKKNEIHAVKKELALGITVLWNILWRNRNLLSNVQFDIKKYILFSSLSSV